jgi:hypothetical protein
MNRSPSWGMLFHKDLEKLWHTGDKDRKLDVARIVLFSLCRQILGEVN